MSTQTTELNTREDVVRTDLDYMLSSLSEEFSAMAGKHVLITGGAGFLGYYLIQSLLRWNDAVPREQRIAVTVYDNFIRGVPAWLSPFGSRGDLELVRQDVTKPLPVPKRSFQYIIHAASIASPSFYRKYPLETMDANVNGLRSLLEYAREQKDFKAPVEGVLFFSTSEIYGDPEEANIPTVETYRGNVSCTGPRACYDESKRFGETLCVTFARAYGLPVKIVRPFNNYGPGLDINDKRVIPDFMKNVLQSNDIIMFSDGRPSRTFCYIADAVTGYYKALLNGKAGEAYNIGVPSPEITMAELAQRIVEVARTEFGYQGAVRHHESEEEDYLVDNPNRRCPVIEKAREELGYGPSIELGDGLRRSLIWYREAELTGNG